MITVRDFSTPLPTIKRMCILKISKDIGDLNSTTHQLDLADIYKTLHPTIDYIFFSSALGTFTDIVHI